MKRLNTNLALILFLALFGTNIKAAPKQPYSSQWGNFYVVELLNDTLILRMVRPPVTAWERLDSTRATETDSSAAPCSRFVTRKQIEYWGTDTTIIIDTIPMTSGMCRDSLIKKWYSRGFQLGGPKWKFSDIWSVRGHFDELRAGRLVVDTMIITDTMIEWSDSTNIAMNSLLLGGYNASYFLNNQNDTGIYLRLLKGLTTDTLWANVIYGIIHYADSSYRSKRADSAITSIYWAGHSWGDRYPLATWADTAGVCMAAHFIWADTAWRAKKADTAFYAVIASVCTTAQNSMQWNGHAWGVVYPRADTCYTCMDSIIYTDTLTALLIKVDSLRARVAKMDSLLVDVIKANGSGQIKVQSNLTTFYGNITVVGYINTDSIVGLSYIFTPHNTPLRIMEIGGFGLADKKGKIIAMSAELDSIYPDGLGHLAIMAKTFFDSSVTFRDTIFTGCGKMWTDSVGEYCVLYMDFDSVNFLHNVRIGDDLDVGGNVSVDTIEAKVYTYSPYGRPQFLYFLGDTSHTEADSLFEVNTNQFVGGDLATNRAVQNFYGFQYGALLYDSLNYNSHNEGQDNRSVENYDDYMFGTYLYDSLNYNSHDEGQLNRSVENNYNNMFGALLYDSLNYNSHNEGQDNRSVKNYYNNMFGVSLYDSLNYNSHNEGLNNRSVGNSFNHMFGTHLYDTSDSYSSDFGVSNISGRNWYSSVFGKYNYFWLNFFAYDFGNFDTSTNNIVLFQMGSLNYAHDNDYSFGFGDLNRTVGNQYDYQFGSVNYDSANYYSHDEGVYNRSVENSYNYMFGAYLYDSLNYGSHNEGQYNSLINSYCTFVFGDYDTVNMVKNGLAFGTNIKLGGDATLDTFPAVFGTGVVNSSYSVLLGDQLTDSNNVPHSFKVGMPAYFTNSITGISDELAGKIFFDGEYRVAKYIAGIKATDVVNLTLENRAEDDEHFAVITGYCKVDSVIANAWTMVILGEWQEKAIDDSVQYIIIRK